MANHAPPVMIFCIDLPIFCSQEHQQRWVIGYQMLTRPVDDAGCGYSDEDAEKLYSERAEQSCKALYERKVPPEDVGVEAFHLMTWESIFQFVGKSILTLSAPSTGSARQLTCARLLFSMVRRARPC